MRQEGRAQRNSTSAPFTHTFTNRGAKCAKSGRSPLKNVGTLLSHARVSFSPSLSTLKKEWSAVIIAGFVRRCAATVCLAVSCLAAPSAGNAAAILRVESGILTGASGVTIAGLPGTYIVEFLDGSCLTVYLGCVAPHFPFNATFALAASQSLLDQVFIDGDLPFDSNPALTRGCSGSTRGCLVLTPFNSGVGGINNVLLFIAAHATNTGPGSPFSEGVTSTFGAAADDYTTQPIFTWARWCSSTECPQVSAVPEPDTSFLLGLAGSILVLAQRRRRKNTPER